ncbi:hypothetical protein [uncultured Gimesia sp.]|jgi:hypothetical protein|uniref:hypothetical protein n=1 Tax=uncultured Gimesia sp. TaxID=1678688 RepID=UPI00262F6C0D|nr:hypothetical protein [uncultured Gimesia sp.]
MKLIPILLLVLAFHGCHNNSPQAPAVSPGLTQEQLVPTLQKIAETGEYDAVLQDLTAGLENAGYMEEAVSVQSFQEFSKPEDVKKLATLLASRIQK